MLPDWRGQIVVVLGGGPSLTGTAARIVARARLQRRCRVIAANDAVYLAWWADWLHAADAKWWHWNYDYVHRFGGLMSTVDDVPYRKQVHKFELTGRSGFDRRRTKMRGTNSGYQALHGAIAAGAEKVVLVGFDMHSGHWFDGPADTYAADYVQAMVPHFKTLGRTLKARGVRVVNCSSGSAIKCFPFEDLGRSLGQAGTPIGPGSPALLSLPALH